MMALSIIILHILLNPPKKKKKSYSTYGCIWYCSTHQIKKKKKTYLSCFVDLTKGNTFSKDKDLSEAIANDL